MGRGFEPAQKIISARLCTRVTGFLAAASVGTAGRRQMGLRDCQRALEESKRVFGFKCAAGLSGRDLHRQNARE